MSIPFEQPSTGRLRGIVEWLREGYPLGVPSTDYVPLLALLRRRLTEEEVRRVAALVASTVSPGDSVDTIDIGVEVTRITDAVPDEADVVRVEALLTEHHGWPDGT